MFTLQTSPICDAQGARYARGAGSPEEQFGGTVGEVTGFNLHAGVAARVNERKKFERLCRYISRPAVSAKRLSLTPNGNIRYQLKAPYRDGTTSKCLKGQHGDIPIEAPRQLVPCIEPVMCTALVEAGITYGQLYDYVQEHNLPLILSFFVYTCSEVPRPAPSYVSHKRIHW